MHFQDAGNRKYLSLVRKDLSFISRVETTGELAGFIFGFDLTDDPAGEGSQIAEFLSHFREAVAMIDELESRYLDRDRIPAGSVLHIFQIGVARKYRRRRIAEAMILRVLAHAQERGFRQAVADCTSPVSKRTFGRCGFLERGFFPYEAFSMDGVRFFAGLEGGITLMARDLDHAQ